MKTITAEDLINDVRQDVQQSAQKCQAVLTREGELQVIVIGLEDLLEQAPTAEVRKAIRDAIRKVQAELYEIDPSQFPFTIGEA